MKSSNIFKFDYINITQKTGRDLFFMAMYICCVLFSGCEDFVEVDPPDTSLVGETVFNNDNDAEAALSGMYSDIVQSFIFSSNQGLTIYTGRSSDILLNFSGLSEDIEFFENDILPDNFRNENVWRVLYQMVYRSNSVIEGVQNGSGLTDSLAKRFEGEAKFIRAISHFYLTNLYGEVPIVRLSDYQVNSMLPRSSIEEVYNQVIIPDLLDAQSLLPLDYYSQDNLRSRPNKLAATALLAKAYLYQENWSNAEVQSSAVIDNNLYELEDNLDDVFLTESREIIWHQQSINDFLPTYEGFVYIPFSIPSNASLRNEFIDEFDPVDMRLSNWVGTTISGSNTYYYPFKYKIRFGSGAPSELLSILRLGEQYLIRAEARAQQNNIEGARADLNMIRNRAGLSDISVALNQDELLEAIALERKFELFTEVCNRWFDLKRTRRANSVLSEIKSGWQETDELWPIPAEEFNNNPNLGQQNLGY